MKKAAILKPKPLNQWTLFGGNMMGVPVGGWQTIADGLLKGIDVRLNSPVKAIRQVGNTGVQVELRSGETLDCSACICTVPLGVLKAGDIVSSHRCPRPSSLSSRRSASATW